MGVSIGGVSSRGVSSSQTSTYTCNASTHQLFKLVTSDVELQ